MTVRAITAGELAKFRGGGQYSQVFVLPRVPNVIYSAEVATTPTTHDMVAEVAISGGVDVSGVRLDMKILVGTTAGSDDVGFCRVRKLPSVDVYGDGTLYVGEISHIDWAAGQHITIVDDYDIMPRHLRIVSGEAFLDYDVEYHDQHEDFEPIVNMGGHRVLYLDPDTGTVSHVRNCTDEGSQVFGGTIASYLWEAPNASSISGETTDEATFEYDTEGHFVEYCTLTSDDGKSFTGVRYVFILDKSTLESYVHSLRISESVREGLSMDFEMSSNAKLTDFRYRAFVIAFAIDYYGGVEETISYRQYEGNILGTGRISDERLDFNDEMGLVRFSARDIKYWLRRIAAFPFGLEKAKKTPTLWTSMPGLNVDRAVWELLHYYCTVTRIADLHLSGDTRYAEELASTSSNILSQLEEITGTTIYADLVFDTFGIGWIRIDPQLVPEEDRTGWVEIQEITSDDWTGELSLELNTHEETSQIDASGVSVEEFGTGSAHFSLSYGHIPSPFGDASTAGNLLLESQAQSNQLAGLLMGWDNRRFDSVTHDLVGNNRMFSLAEYCKAYTVITDADNPRGIDYDGDLIPIGMSRTWDAESGFLNTVIDFQDESHESSSVDGDFPPDTNIPPGGGDFPIPDIELPVIPIVQLPAPELNPNKPKRVVVATDKGVLWTENANEDDEADIVWQFMNSGLVANDRTTIVNMVVTPSGGMYLFTAFWRVYYAPYPGGSWTEIASATDFPYGIMALGADPTSNDRVIIVGLGAGIAAAKGNVIVASYGNVTKVDAQIPCRDYYGAVVWSAGKWLAFGSNYGFFTTPWVVRLSPGGTAEYDGSINTAVGQDAAQRYAQAIGESDTVYQWDASGAGGFNIITQGGTVITRSTVFNPAASAQQGMAFSPTGINAMAATGALNTPYKSTDSGASWQSVGGTIPAGGDAWENCRDDNRWIFGGGTAIKVTLDQGATAYGIAGNLSYIAGLYDIGVIRYLP